MKWTEPKEVNALKWIFLAAGVLFFSGCIGNQPAVKYQPGSQSATPGQVNIWNFDTDPVYTDVVLSAHFKPISGSTDRAAGLIFRVQDRDNYYILRANALENNVNIYRYAGGQRSLIKEDSARVESGQWQELRAEVAGNRIRGFLNGELVVEGMDDTFKAGKVGLWTKADSVTCFDDITARVQLK